MGIGKQAKILTEKQLRTALAYVSEHHRYPLRDRVMLLLSFKAGLTLPPKVRQRTVSLENVGLDG